MKTQSNGFSLFIIMDSWLNWVHHGSEFLLFFFLISNNFIEKNLVY